jgi:hypothetical protein
MVSDRTKRQKAIDGMTLRKIKLLQLGIVPAYEVMNMKIFVAFALGKPKDGGFETGDLTDRSATDLPIGPQRLARLISRIGSAQLNGQRGRRVTA